MGTNLANETMSDHNDDKQNGDNQTGVVIKTRPKTKKPSMYKVLMLNDDYTPMEFVVHVLEHFSTNPARTPRASCCMSIRGASGSAACTRTKWRKPR